MCSNGYLGNKAADNHGGITGALKSCPGLDKTFTMGPDEK